MAVISGVNGAVYWNEELTDTAAANSIIFSSGDNTITASTAGGVSSTGILDFVAEGYKSNMLFTLSGAGTTENNRIFTISTVTTGTITVSEAVTSSTGAGDTDTGTITFLETEPGYEEAGFYNWAIDYKIDLFDTTAFDTSSGGRTYIPSITNWTAKADKYCLSTGYAVNDWVGDTVKARFFLNYVATPTTGDASQYYEGNTIVTGISQGTSVDALITQNISFQGDGALTLKTQIAPWSSGIST